MQRNLSMNDLILESSRRVKNLKIILPSCGSCKRKFDQVFDEEKDESNVNDKTRCHSCRRILGITGTTCRCGHTYCGLHRYPQEHNCEYDHQSRYTQQLQKSNKTVKNNKLEDNEE